MAAITASMVAELRAKTDAPMMECKKALTEAEGDMERAEELLRVKLGNKASKAASRVTAEGIITAHIDGGVGSLVEELTHEYPERSVHLRFYVCHWLLHEPRAIHCQALAWITAEELSAYEFPAADLRILARLREAWVSLASAPPPTRAA